MRASHATHRLTPDTMQTSSASVTLPCCRRRRCVAPTTSVEIPSPNSQTNDRWWWWVAMVTPHSLPSSSKSTVTNLTPHGCQSSATNEEPHRDSWFERPPERLGGLQSGVSHWSAGRFLKLGIIKIVILMLQIALLLTSLIATTTSTTTTWK